MEISKKVLWVHDNPIEIFPTMSERLKTAVMTNDEGTLQVTHLKLDQYGAGSRTLAEHLLTNSAPHEVIAGEFHGNVIAKMCQMIYSQRMQRALECLPPPPLPRVFIPVHLRRESQEAKGMVPSFSHWEEL